MPPDWNQPLTEAGMQSLLSQIADSRTCNDEPELAKGLLALSHMVKWVRSDNRQAPFERSHTLAMEALSIFRKLGDKRGTARALRAAAPFAGPENSLAMLEESMAIARELGDGLELARAISAKAKHFGLIDRVMSRKLNLEALELFRNVDHTEGIAWCCFGLSIGEGTNPEKRGYAVEAAQNFRRANDPKHAALSMTIAAMNYDTDEELLGLELEFRLGLKDSHEIGDAKLQEAHYRQLVKIADLKNDPEEAERYRRFAKELSESDGLTDKERKKNLKEGEKILRGIAKTMGATKALKEAKAKDKRKK